MLDTKMLAKYTDALNELTAALGGTWKDTLAGPLGYSVSMRQDRPDGSKVTLVIQDYCSTLDMKVEVTRYVGVPSDSDQYWSSSKRLQSFSDAAEVSATIEALSDKLNAKEGITRPQYPNTKATRLPVFAHGGKEWQLSRANTIGASEVAAVMGRSKYRGLLSVVQTKRDLLKGIVEEKDSQVMFEGRVAEEFILKMASHELGTTIAPGEALGYGPMSATPDGLVIQDGLVTAPVEAKLERSGADWSAVADGTTPWDALPAGDIRGMYYLQAMAQIALTGCTHGYLAVWTTYEFHLIRIERNDLVIIDISTACYDAMEWVNDEQGRWPTAGPGDSPFALAQTISPARDEAVAVEGDAAEAMSEYVRLGEEIDTLDALRTEAKKRVIAAHAASSVLIGPDGIRSKFNGPGKRSSVDTKMLKTIYPEVAAAVTKETTTEGTCTIRRGKGAAT